MTDREFHDFARRLVRLRNRHHYSQAEFAKICGLTQVTLSNIEQEKHYPTGSTWRKITKVIDELEKKEAEY